MQQLSQLLRHIGAIKPLYGLIDNSKKKMPFPVDHPLVRDKVK